MAFFAPNGLLGSTSSTLTTNAESTMIGGASLTPNGLLPDARSEGERALEEEGLAPKGE